MRYAHWLLCVLLSGGLVAQAEERAFELNQEGVTAAAAGKLDKAVELFEQAWLSDSKAETIRTNLCVVLVRRAREHVAAGRSIAAETDVRRALQLEAQDPNAIALLLDILRRRGELAQARCVLPDVKSAAAGDARVLSSRALLAYDEDLLDEAVSAAQAALTAPEAATLIDIAGLKVLLSRWQTEAETEGGFLREVGAGFTVKYPGLEERERAREVLDAAQRAASSIEVSLGARPQRGLVIVLLARKSYLLSAGAPEWSGGRFDGRVRIPLERREREEDQLRRTLTHEMVHWFLRTLAPACPTWLHEGLAQHHEGRATSDTKVLTKEETRKPLRESPEDWSALSNRDEVSLLYRHALAYTEWLIERHGAAALRTVFQSLREQLPFETAFARAFGFSQEEAERIFRSTLR
ncbi:MAG: hypothetical protein EXS14_04320 [Planctomycetes bacterium]|nr:hypothetical protein [Planctomycetota bacterium]